MISRCLDRSKSSPLRSIAIEWARSRTQAGIVAGLLLNHPNGATGYRVEFGGRVLCYVTDCEHKKGTLDRGILDLIQGADVFIYDSTYTDEEYGHYVGWGHSTWQEGVRLCEAAGVKKLLIFHHDPSHDDIFMDKVAAAATKARPGSLVANEGLVLEL
jgi:phosphoribosyl 1,2-cyclic phosphodiesterase